MGMGDGGWGTGMGETGATRGRPRSFDRDAALAAATRLFWERGHGATSIGELTEAMGIRPASLYAAFGDKRSLFEESVAAYGEDAGRVLHGQGAGGAHGLRRVRADPAGDRAELRGPLHPAGCLTIRAATNVTPQDAEVGAGLRGLRNANLVAWEGRLRAARQEGELPPEANPQVLAGYFAAVIQVMSQRSCDGADAADAAELAEIAELALAAWPGAREG